MHLKPSVEYFALYISSLCSGHLCIPESIIALYSMVFDVDA